MPVLSQAPGPGKMSAARGEGAEQVGVCSTGLGAPVAHEEDLAVLLVLLMGLVLSTSRDQSPFSSGGKAPSKGDSGAELSTCLGQRMPAWAGPLWEPAPSSPWSRPS